MDSKQMNLVNLSEDSLIELKKKNENDSIMVSLINELAVAKGYLKVNPYITLKTVDEIVNKRNERFELVFLELKKVEEGSMAMEYDYDLIFQTREYDSCLYGARLRAVPLVNGEIWDDYVANDEDELVKVSEAIEEKEVKIVYKF
jgi:hypothetical protein